MPIPEWDRSLNVGMSVVLPQNLPEKGWERIGPAGERGRDPFSPGPSLVPASHCRRPDGSTPGNETAVDTRSTVLAPLALSATAPAPSTATAGTGTLPPAHAPTLIYAGWLLSLFRLGLTGYAVLPAPAQSSAERAGAHRTFSISSWHDHTSVLLVNGSPPEWVESPAYSGGCPLPKETVGIRPQPFVLPDDLYQAQVVPL